MSQYPNVNYLLIVQRHRIEFRGIHSRAYYRYLVYVVERFLVHLKAREYCDTHYLPSPSCSCFPHKGNYAFVFFFFFKIVFSSVYRFDRDTGSDDGSSSSSSSSSSYHSSYQQYYYSSSWSVYSASSCSMVRTTIPTTTIFRLSMLLLLRTFRGSQWQCVDQVEQQQQQQQQQQYSVTTRQHSQQPSSSSSWSRAPPAGIFVVSASVVVVDLSVVRWK